MSTSREDVLKVAKYMRMEPTEEQIQHCIDNFDAQAEYDPTGEPDIWIEDLLLDQDVKQLPKKYRFFLYDYTCGEVADMGELTEDEAELYEAGPMKPVKLHQLYVELALVEMRKDFESGDLTAIEELLQKTMTSTLKNYLPEEQWIEE